MPKSLSNSPLFVSLIRVLLICAAFNLNAQSVSEDYGSIDLGQGNSAILIANSSDQTLANNACAPTATANGLAYLYGLDSAAFTADPDNYTAVNNLITAMGTTDAGTTGTGAIDGLQSYLNSPTGANPAPGVISTQNSDPTASTMAASLGTALTANDAVQLGILWGTISGGTLTAFKGGGGHFVSLTGMNLADGAGTMTILDPWGSGSGNNAGITADAITLNVSTVTLGSISVLKVQYGYLADDVTTIPGTENPADTTSQDGTGTSEYGFGTQYDVGYIALADIESVPEPTTLALLGAGSLALLARRRWQV